MTSAAHRHDEIHEIDKLRIRILYGQSKVAQAIALINLVIVFMLFRNAAPPFALTVWGSLSLGVYGFRLALQFVFRRRYLKSGAEFDPGFWENAHAATTAISGFIWGSSVFFVLPRGSIVEQTFLGFLLAGTTAGATVAYATSLRTAFGFLLPAIVPFALTLTIGGSEIQQAMAALLVLYVLVLSSAMRRLNRMLVDSMRLRFEQTRLVRELKETQDKLVHSAKLSALGEMAAGIAHEINNPLAIIHFYSTQLAEAGLPASATEIAAKIDKTSERIAKIVAGLRAFARGDAMDKLQPVDLDSVVGETLELCQVRRKKQRVLLLAGRVPPGVKINCRGTQIVQVLLNLLNNAFDAVAGSEEAWIGVDVQVLDERITVAVSDNGPGISPENRKRIMQPFFTTKETGKGTGLGLSIAHGIAAAHGGSLTLDETSKQTRFILTLPRITDASVPVSRFQHEAG